jgi:hypothetical protein
MVVVEAPTVVAQSVPTSTDWKAPIKLLCEPVTTRASIRPTSWDASAPTSVIALPPTVTV